MQTQNLLLLAAIALGAAGGVATPTRADAHSAALPAAAVPSGQESESPGSFLAYCRCDSSGCSGCGSIWRNGFEPAACVMRDDKIECKKLGTEPPPPLEADDFPGCCSPCNETECHGCASIDGWSAPCDKVRATCFMLLDEPICEPIESREE